MLTRVLFSLNNVLFSLLEMAQTSDLRDSQARNPSSQ